MADRVVRDENDAGVSRLDVDMGDGTFAERYIGQPPAFLLTGIYADKRPRMRVDEGSTGFFEGREFRMYVEFNIPVGGELWVKHIITNNFILHDQRITLVKQGELRWSAVAGTATSPGPWTNATFRRRNQMTEQPNPMFTSGSTMQTSGTTGAATGGFEVDVQRLVVEKDSASAIQNAGMRGLAAGTYHARLQNLGATAAIGVYDWWWEERPSA